MLTAAQCATVAYYVQEHGFYCRPCAVEFDRELCGETDPVGSQEPDPMRVARIDEGLSTDDVIRPVSAYELSEQIAAAACPCWENWEDNCTCDAYACDGCGEEIAG